MLCITGIEKGLTALKARLADNRPAPLQEIRLDALGKLPTSSGFFPCDPARIIATCRRAKDGGLFKGPEEERISRLESACSLGVGWVDVEADLADCFAEKIRKSAERYHTKLLRSIHLGSDVGSTEIQGAFTLLRGIPGDAIKIVIPTNDVADLAYFFKAPKDRPAVMVGTGQAGLLTRALHSRLGSAWTYIAASRETSPFPHMPDVDQAALLGLPLKPKSRIYVLLGHSSIVHSPGLTVYHHLFRQHGIDACYLAAVTDRLEDAFQVLCKLGLNGASVTIPFKPAAVHLADELDRDARNSGVVNTLYKMNDIWRGGNTDMNAVRTMAERLGGKAGHRAMILGTGGFARAGAWALADLGMSVTLLSRTFCEEPGPWEDCVPIKSLSDSPFHLILNATPVGGAAGKKSPVPEKVSLQGKVVLDGVLSPQNTALVRHAAASGARVGTGIELWAEQGSAQCRLLDMIKTSPKELLQLACTVGGITPPPDNRRSRRSQPLHP